MKCLSASLVLVAAVGLALALTAGDGRSTGDADTPGPAVPDVLGRAPGRQRRVRAFPTRRGHDAHAAVVLGALVRGLNHEAPAIEQLAADARGELAVVAIGGRDKAANGPAFVTRHRLRTPTILFDEPMAAWESYAIPGQPAGVLLDRDGRERGRWLGAFDPADVLAAARGL